jgi:hypothetical protein
MKSFVEIMYPKVTRSLATIARHGTVPGGWFRRATSRETKWFISVGCRRKVLDRLPPLGDESFR